MSQLTQARLEKDGFFRSDPHSPIPEEERKGFTGLSYYPESRALRFEVVLNRFDGHETVLMQTSTGDVQHHHKLGSFSFEVDGQQATLTAYGSGASDAFVPFTDATSGSETYGAGRYLELHWLGGDKYAADFNQAYNPWCAYSPLYSCPIPPIENRLKVPVRAGEKDYATTTGPLST